MSGFYNDRFKEPPPVPLRGKHEDPLTCSSCGAKDKVHPPDPFRMLWAHCTPCREKAVESLEEMRAKIKGRAK